MAARQLGLRFLKEKVVAVVKLRPLEPKPGAETFAMVIAGKSLRLRDRAWPDDAKPPVRPPIREAEFIGVAGSKSVAVGEGEIVMREILLSNKTRKS